MKRNEKGFAEFPIKVQFLQQTLVMNILKHHECVALKRICVQTLSKGCVKVKYIPQHTRDN